MTQRDINITATTSIEISMEHQGDSYTIFDDDGAQMGLAETIFSGVEGSEQHVWLVRIWAGGELPEDMTFLVEPSFYQIENCIIGYFQNRYDNALEVMMEQMKDHFAER